MYLRLIDYRFNDILKEEVLFFSLINQITSEKFCIVKCLIYVTDLIRKIMDFKDDYINLTIFYS